MAGPKSPQDYSAGFDAPEWPDDAALEEEGKAAGLDVWEQVTKAYENYVQDGELANAQLWSLREAILREVRSAEAEASTVCGAEYRGTLPGGDVIDTCRREARHELHEGSALRW